jgi:ribosomal-protein-alanine N-acetyltransferase
MVKKSDVNDLFELCRRPETSMYSVWNPHKSINDTKDLISFRLSQYRKGQCTFFVIEEKASGRVIGSCSYVTIDENYKSAEIGYSILSDRWNMGYATEAAAALIGFAFDRIGVIRVYAKVLPPNTASVRVLEKLGFQYEGTLKKAYYFEGKVSDINLFAITDDMYYQGRNL